MIRRYLPDFGGLSFSVDIFRLASFFSVFAASPWTAATTLPEASVRHLDLGVGNSIIEIGYDLTHFKSATCPLCSSMPASLSVSTRSGAVYSGTTIVSTVGADVSVGGDASGMFFLSSTICKFFCGMKKASLYAGRVKIISLHGVIYQSATLCPDWVAYFFFLWYHYIILVPDRRNE